MYWHYFIQDFLMAKWGHFRANLKRIFRPDSTLNYLVSFWAGFKIIIDSKINGCAIPSDSRNPRKSSLWSFQKTTSKYLIIRLFLLMFLYFLHEFSRLMITNATFHLRPPVVAAWLNRNNIPSSSSNSGDFRSQRSVHDSERQLKSTLIHPTHNSKLSHQINWIFHKQNLLQIEISLLISQTCNLVSKIP
jgi:hypothetical protein